MSQISLSLRRRLLLLLTFAVSLGLLAGTLPASGQVDAAGEPAGPSFEDYGFQGEGHARVEDLDNRLGKLAPSADALAVAKNLGATSIRWNRYGTPHVLMRHGGFLTAARSGSAVRAAKSFVAENAALFGGAANLQVINDSPLYESDDQRRLSLDKKPRDTNVSHVVLFRQKFGELKAGLDGLLTIGVNRNNRIGWVSSSVTSDTTVRGAQTKSALEAVNAAVADAKGAGADLELGPLSEVTSKDSWTTFSSELSPDVQRARLVALPTATNGVQLAYEVVLLDTTLDEHGNPTSFTSFVDASSGKVWHRTNQVEHLAEGLHGAGAAQVGTPSGGRFSGSTEKVGSCTAEPGHEFKVAPDNEQIIVGAAATTPPEVSDDDITIQLYFGATLVKEADLLTSPEILEYTPEGGVPAGTYFVRICEFTPSDATSIPYQGGFFAGEGVTVRGENGAIKLPTWRVFPANPPFVSDQVKSDDSKDTRRLWCWDNDTDPNCDQAQSPERNPNTAARMPWDVQADVDGSRATFTTDGNYASTAISEVSFVTPDTAANRPFSLTRDYDYEWDNTWFEAKCNPANFGLSDNVEGGTNDESAAVTNLFVMHNRMHDWSYYLGFNERNFNLQQSNFGNTGPERARDPELGSAQAGRRTFRGRDNANQITLNDGIAPITNQYLWQPLAGAFYAPCVDGAYDMAVVAHEYTHAITNRMIAGPDTGTGPTQGQSESWSDLGFAAYFMEFKISAGDGVNELVLGPYVTGDKGSGIRNYAMNKSPLNYSNIEYDGTGLTSPHANGEIWSAANADIFKALNRKYDKGFPSDNNLLQTRCARGRQAAYTCPGNRRWNQIQFDSFLIQPSGSTMIDSRDAMLAADLLRFRPAVTNQRELWNAFARRGLGMAARSIDANDLDPRPGWNSPERGDEAIVKFRAPEGVKNMDVFVGKYEARITPSADTKGKTKLGNSIKMVPGKYRFLAQAKGYGARRFTLRLGSNDRRTFTVPMRKNLASVHNGASAKGDGVNFDRLIDDTEGTNWASRTADGTASEGKGEGRQVEGRQVTFNLAGGVHKVDKIQVSAVLNAGCTAGLVGGDCDPEEQDTGSQSRFSALRSFNVFACNANAGGDCKDKADFDRIFTSRDDAFPGRRPRPTVPDLLLRSFDVRDTRATHIRMVVRDNQCTGGRDFQGERNEDNDPQFNPDCDNPTAQAENLGILNPPEDLVRAAEFQVFGR